MTLMHDNYYQWLYCTIKDASEYVGGIHDDICITILTQSGTFLALHELPEPENDHIKLCELFLNSNAVEAL